LGGVECGGRLTIIKVGDCFENVAIGVERLWPTDPTGGVPVRIQEDLGVDEIPGGDPLVQSLAKSRGGCHACRMSERAPFVIEGIYTMQQICPFWLTPQHEPKRTAISWFG